MKKENIFGLITTNKNLYHSFNIQKKIYLGIKSKYKKFFIIDMSNFLILEKKDIFNKRIKLPKNIIYFKPKNLDELNKFIINKNLIFFNNLGKSFNYFRIYLILKNINIKLLLLLNLGDIGNEEIEAFSAISLYEKFLKSSQNFIFNIFLFFKIFPQIEVYFHTNKYLVNKINNLNKNKSKKFLSRFFNLNYIKKASLINTRQNNYPITKRFISFIDSNFYHPDRVKRELKINNHDAEIYFNKLNFLLERISKKFKKKTIICLHPSSNKNIYKKYLKNFTLIKHDSQKIISNSYLTLFHESSLIIDSLNLKKPIILLKSKFLGKFMYKRIEKYLDKYKLKSLNMDLDYNQIIYQINKISVSKIIRSKNDNTSKLSPDKLILNEISSL